MSGTVVCRACFDHDAMCMAFERKGAARAQRAERSTQQRLAEQNNKRSPSPAVYAGERARGSAGGGAPSAITRLAAAVMSLF